MGIRGKPAIAVYFVRCGSTLLHLLAFCFCCFLINGILAPFSLSIPILICFFTHSSLVVLSSKLSRMLDFIVPSIYFLISFNGMFNCA
ncbi:hypothetical protein CW304_15960 [Bacillus sp. UFRGS-B20]|nr:hypothetical protein CW304_15960 [Bacillus sp. UFRGS-B20]